MGAAPGRVPKGIRQGQGGLLVCPGHGGRVTWPDTHAKCLKQLTFHQCSGKNVGTHPKLAIGALARCKSGKKFKYPTRA
jgi:hypothetical protein